MLVLSCLKLFHQVATFAWRFFSTLGFSSLDVYKRQMYNDASLDDPDPPVAYAEFDRYLSKLDVEHLKEMTAEIKGQYVEGLDKPEFFQFVQSQTPAAKFVTDYSVRWVYLVLAALMILATYLPDALSYKLRKQLG